MRSPLRVRPTLTVRGLRVLADVGQQLARRPVQQRLRLRLTHILEVGLNGQIGAGLELPQQFSHRRREAELGQHLRVQLRDGRAQSGRGFLQRRVDHVERGVGIAFARLIEFEPRGQQRLQRAVVQVLGDFAVVPLVGLHCLRDQLTAHLLQRLHPRGPTGEHVSTARSPRRPARAGSRSACTPCSASRPCRRASE